MSEEDQAKLVIKLERKEDGLYHCILWEKEYAFRKWTWGEKNKLYSECSRFENGEPKFESGEFYLQMLLRTLKIAPFPLTREAIENYPDAVLIDILQKITEKLNMLGQIEIKNL